MNSDAVYRRRRGEPLAVLGLLIALWIGVRIVMWQSPFPSTFPAASAAQVRIPNPFAKSSERVVPTNDQPTPARLSAISRSDAPRGVALSEVSSPMDRAFGTAFTLPAPQGSPAIAAPASLPPLLVPPIIARPFEGTGRWQFAAWAGWRAGSGLPSLASGARPASYGGTQVGALASFNPSNNENAPALYVRATYAPDHPRQRDLAAGAAIRPLAAVPVRVMAEMRATHGEGQDEVRPAILAVTALEPFALPLGLTAEGYGQAGWVGGRYGTAFADGQAHLVRPIAAIGKARIRAGAGAWGGAQKFAERLDVGPTVVLDLAQGPAAIRASLDYRIKVAGNASPGNGVALTLSTGF